MLNASSSSRGSVLWIIGAIAATAALQGYLWPHLTDDAYISFRYALNLARGHGLVFNPGEYVEGFSNPLWTLLLAGLQFITGLQIPDLARVCGFALTLGTLGAVFRIVRTIAEPDTLPALSLALLLIVANPGFHVYATAGLEGPLLGFLLTAGVALSFSESRLAAALVFGLAGITRPEGPAYAFLWFLATVRPSPDLQSVIRKEAVRFLVMIAPIAGWQIFRLEYYGTWLPNTAIAKVPGVFAEFINFPEYITPWLVAAGGPLILLLWLVLPPRGEPIRSLERICLAIVGGNLIFIVYARGDWMPFGRFIVPVWPVVSVPLALWIASGVRWLSYDPLLRFRRLLPLLPAAGVVLASVLAWYPAVSAYVQNDGMNMLMRGTDQLAVGDWIAKNIRPGSTIATGRLGGISYGAMEYVVWDWFGLTDAEEAAFIRKGRRGNLAEDPVFGRNPDVIAAIEAPADWSYKRTTPLMDFLKENYIFVMGFPQGRYGYVDIWIRRSRLDEIFLTKEQFIL